MRSLKTAVCVDCDASALLETLGVTTLSVCQTYKEMVWMLSYRPDVIVTTGPAELADRIRAGTRDVSGHDLYTGFAR